MTMYVSWRDPDSKSWFITGKLTKENSLYKFKYTKGSNNKNFTPFEYMRDMFKEYVSKDLFPLFANRILTKHKEQYVKFKDWLGIEDEDPMLILSRGGGERSTDTYHLYPEPEKTPCGNYEAYFLVHGIRYLPEYAQKEVDNLVPGCRLHLMFDFQNQYHQEAVAIRTESTKTIIGYLPRYMASDFKDLVSKTKDKMDIHLTVQKVNNDAPIQMKLLCKITAPWPESFNPCSNDQFDTII